MGELLELDSRRVAATRGMEPFHTGGILALNAAVAALLAAVPDRERILQALADAEREAQTTLDGLAGGDGAVAPEAVGYRIAMRMFHDTLGG